MSDEVMTERELVWRYLRTGEERRFLLESQFPEQRSLVSLRLPIPAPALHLPRKWTKALFGAIGDQPSTIASRVSDGSRGRRTLYQRSALERLDYIVGAAKAGLGPDKIHVALKHGIPKHAVYACGDPRNLRYSITRPLVRMLRLYRAPTSKGGLVGKGVRRTFSKPRVFHELWRWDQRSEDALQKTARVRGLSPVEAECFVDTDTRFKNALPLGLYLEPPADENEYFRDFDRLVQAELAGLVAAMCRVADNPSAVTAADRETIVPYVDPRYRIEREVFVDVRGRHSVHRIQVRDGHVPLTFLQHCASHLWAIRDDVGAWVRRCGRCGRYFAVYDSRKGRCEASGCR